MHDLIVQLTNRYHGYVPRDRVPELELGNQLCFALYRASRALIRAYGPALGELGLTYPQYLVMLALWEDDQSWSVRELGDRLSLDSGTLTPLLKRMESQGLVERHRDDVDERRTLITLTAHGRALRERASEVPASISHHHPLDPKTGRTLLADLVRIAEAFEAARAP